MKKTCCCGTICLKAGKERMCGVQVLNWCVRTEMECDFYKIDLKEKYYERRTEHLEV